MKVLMHALRGASCKDWKSALMISNVMSLVPKIDELREVIHNSDVEIVCITETWLRDHIDDNVVNLMCQDLGWFALTELTVNTGESVCT
jgi:hypothetical protein